MRKYHSTRQLFVLLALSLSLGSALALDKSELSQLRPGATLSVPALADTSKSTDLQIEHVHTIREGASVWYQLEGRAADHAQTVYVDFTAKPPTLAWVEATLELKTLVRQPRKFINMTDRSGKGEIELNGEVFSYVEDESDEAFLDPDGDKSKAEEFNFMTFRSKQTPKRVLQIMVWDDNEFETHLLREMDASLATLR